MQKPIAFIFDLEGVLIDHTARQCEVATKALASVGINVSITPKVYQLRSEREFHTTRDFLSGLVAMQHTGISFEQAKANPAAVASAREKMDAATWAIIDKAVKRFDHLRTHGRLEIPGKPPVVIVSKEPRLQKIAQMLHVSVEKGIPIVMVTMGKKVDADAFMQESGIMKYFKPEHLFYGEDKATKGELFREASGMIVRKYGVRPGRQWVIEDSLSGIRDAKANGLRSAIVLTGNTSLERIQRLPATEKPTLVLQHAKDLLGTLIHTWRGQNARFVRRGVGTKVKQTLYPKKRKRT